jgi:YVTN family beta-propeller protein
MTSIRPRVTIRQLLAAALLLSLPDAAFGQVRIIQTNSQGENLHVIDPVSNTIVGEITGIPLSHGATASPDGRRLYVSSEAKRTLDVVDMTTLTIIKEIPLSGRPNNISLSKDGRRLYVAIVSAPGALDVIDTTTLTNLRSLETRGGIHNVYVTPDGRHVVAGSIGGRNLTVFDQATEKPLWSLFEEGVRPIAIETNPDGSTKRLFVQISNHHGFAVVDFATHQEVGRVTLPDVPEAEREPGPFNQAPAHGIGVAPDGKTLWVNSRLNGHVYVYSLPDVTLLGGVKVGRHPDWLTFTPDSKTIYVANQESNSVSAIDIATRKEVARIPVGKIPKRNATLVMR